MVLNLILVKEFWKNIENKDDFLFQNQFLECKKDEFNDE